MTNLDWGNVPAWVTIGIALLAVLVSGGMIGRRRRARQEADRVTAWWGWADDGTINVVLYLKNGGATPIYDSVILFGPARAPRSLDADAWDFQLHTVAPGETQTHTTESHHFVLEAPDHEPDKDGFYGGPFIELMFTDSAGRHWRRTRTRELVRRKDRSIRA